MLLHLGIATLNKPNLSLMSPTVCDLANDYDKKITAPYCAVSKMSPI